MPTSEITYIGEKEKRLLNTKLKEALGGVLSFAERERHGIGMQQEKTMHAVFKSMEDPDEDHHEIPIGRYIADIYHDGSITEIQSAHFGVMRDKLDAFLPEYRVRVVHAIPHVKWVCWIDPVTGRLLQKNKATRRGSFYDVFEELYAVSSYLKHPNLSFTFYLVDLEEYRVQDGWGAGGKRGSHRFDRIPLEIADCVSLCRPEDYMQLIPVGLEEPFTSADLKKAVGVGRVDYSTVMNVLHKVGIAERVGRKGNAYLYRLKED